MGPLEKKNHSVPRTKRENVVPSSLFIIMWGWKSIYLCDTPACGLEKGTEILQYGDDPRIRMEPGSSHLKNSLLVKQGSLRRIQTRLLHLSDFWMILLFWDGNLVIFEFNSSNSKI